MSDNLRKAYGLHSALFDTARITRDLEAAYREMWERQQRGEPPASFAVAVRAAPTNP